MATDGKWVDGLSADTKWAEAAERVFSARLDAVEKNWQLALDERVDVEPVHQLRVATRRANAALQMFADILPKRIDRELRQLLKKVRKVAGKTRDWDVFNIHLSSWAADRPANEIPGLDFLSGMALGQRQSAQADLDRSLRFQEDWLKLRPKIKPQRGKRWRLGQKAPGLVASNLADFQAATEGELADADQLHQVRISGKRLRYALELFVDVLDAQVRDQLLPMMEDVQEVIGDANDARNLRNHIEALRTHLPSLGAERTVRYAPGIDGWYDQLRREEGAGLPRFRDWLLVWRHATSAHVGAGDLNNA